MKLKMVKEDIVTVNLSSLSGNLDRAFFMLENAKVACGEEGYKDLVLRVDDDAYGDLAFVFSGTRPETEKETEARVRKAQATIERRNRTKAQKEALIEERERKQLEKLKAKYENNP